MKRKIQSIIGFCLGLVIAISPIIYGISKGSYSKPKMCPVQINGDYVLDKDGHYVMEKCSKSSANNKMVINSRIKEGSVIGITCISSIGFFISIIAALDIKKRFLRDLVIVILNVIGIIPLLFLHTSVGFLSYAAFGSLPLFAGIGSFVDMILLKKGKKDLWR